MFVVSTTPNVIALSTMYRQCFTNIWTQKEFVEIFTINGTFAVMEPAWKGFGIVRTIADEAEIITMAVLPEARNQGIGHAIVKGMLDQAKTQKAASVFLEVRESNTAAIALYKKTGFTPIAVRKKYYRNLDNLDENAIIMRNVNFQLEIHAI